MTFSLRLPGHRFEHKRESLSFDGQVIVDRACRRIHWAIPPLVLASFDYVCPFNSSLVFECRAKFTNWAYCTKSLISVFKFTDTMALWPAASCVSRLRSWR